MTPTTPMLRCPLHNILVLAGQECAACLIEAAKKLERGSLGRLRGERHEVLVEDGAA